MKNKKKFININMFLYFGIALIAVAVVLQFSFPNLSSSISNVLYIIGILSFIVYMFEIQYQRRTGDYKDEGTSKSKKSKNSKK